MDIRDDARFAAASNRSANSFAKRDSQAAQGTLACRQPRRIRTSRNAATLILTNRPQWPYAPQNLIPRPIFPEVEILFPDIN
jgi:hypothetical protein